MSQVSNKLLQKYSSILPFAVELHVHLVGAVSNETLFGAFKRKNKLPEGVTTPKELEPYVTVTSKTSDLAGFLAVMDNYEQILRGDAIAIKQLCNDFCKFQYENKVYYTETMLEPHEMSDENLPAEEVLKICMKTFEEGCKKYGIKIRILISFLTHWEGLNDERTIKTLEFAKKYKYDRINNPCGIVGCDTAGDEKLRLDDLSRKNDWIKIYSRVKSIGLDRMIHAGEGTNYKSVDYAILKLGVSRIGHGYECIKNDETLKLVKDKNIHLCCCPTSSIITNSVTHVKLTDYTWINHPIFVYSKNGLNFSINTDDPMVMKTNLLNEIYVTKHKIGLSYKQIGNGFIKAAKNVFLKDENEKNEIVKTVIRRVEYWLKHMSNKSKL